jgi:hypothetical protein
MVKGKMIYLKQNQWNWVLNSINESMNEPSLEHKDYETLNEILLSIQGQLTKEVKK